MEELNKDKFPIFENIYVFSKISGEAFRILFFLNQLGSFENMVSQIKRVTQNVIFPNL